MKLIKDIIQIRMRLQNETDVNHFYTKSIWNFYQVYSICLQLTGYIDKNIDRKNHLISKLVSSEKLDKSSYVKILVYMKEDIKVINQAMKYLEEDLEDDSFFGDVYFPGMIGISIYDD